MKDAVRGPLDGVAIAVPAGGGLRDWGGGGLKPPGVSSLWPVFLWEDSVQMFGGPGKALRRKAKGGV